MPRSARNLVIVRAGDRSLHPAWTTSLATRDWDLVVSYFGHDPERFRGDGERRIDDPGLKFPGLHALLSRETFWRDYDYVWLPDDDLMIDQDAISRLFGVVAELELELAQPALSWRSFFSHRITLRRPSFRVRYTGFVEIMAPCLRCEFLDASLPLFGETHSGWGLDWILPRLQPKGALGTAIIDEVEMTHTRPVGGPTYAALGALGISAWDEADALLKRHGVETVHRAAPAIEGDGRRLDPAIASDRARLAELEARDIAAMLAAFGSFELPMVTLAVSGPMPPVRRGR